MADGNGVLKAIDEAIKDEATPTWGRAILLAWRDDHVKLVQHLGWHSRLASGAAKVGVSVASALALIVVLWLLSGRLPSVFAP
jgi:hypothetical protein